MFFHDDGQLKREGDLITMPQYHDFLSVLQIEGKDLFYKGEISKQVSKKSRRWRPSFKEGF